MDAEQVRAEIRQTRASIDRKLDLLSARTCELTENAKDLAWSSAAASMVAVGTTVALVWLKRHA